jgi:hypothetical protein
VDNEEIKLSDLEATKRDHKVEITDIAISKIPYIKYREIPEDQYETLQSLAKAVLKISRDENDCNEVAIAYDLDGPQKELDGEEYLAWAKGDEYSVEPMSDTETNHIIVSAKGCVVVILHNHPNLSKISLEDVMFMLRLPTIKMVVAVTNRGAIGYIVKTEDYEKNRMHVIISYITVIRLVLYMRIIEGGELMVEHKCILSENPDALDGALEWLQAEIKKLETENDKKKKVTESLKADIRPLVQKVAKKRGLVSNR